MGALLGKFALPWFALSTSTLDAGVFQRSRPQTDQLGPTQQQLQHLRVVQTLYGFAIYVGNQICRSQASLERGTAFVHRHHQVMHRVEIRVAVVHPDCVHRKTETARSPPDDQRWLKISD